MDLGVTDRVAPLIEQVREMIDEQIAPLDAEFHAEVGKHSSGDRFKHTARQLEMTLRKQFSGYVLPDMV